MRHRVPLAGVAGHATQSFEVRATAESHFAWMRTRLAIERTMMAWVRTATALIGFGFALAQYLERVVDVPGARRAYLPAAPHVLGLALIGCGILALLISLAQYKWSVRYLSGAPFTPMTGPQAGRMQTPLMAVAAILVGIGMFAFVAVLLHAG
ncbi:MAG TPA: DUF202 domain-containing protein [Acetobacteraceae bacterium]|nr:DUF202 domain-containing protein [Acetobacteraceae bacterium]